MLKTLVEELTSHRLLSRSDHVIVAVSGGRDSMALLHLLLELNQQEEWQLRLHVAHLNHQLRGEEAERDAAFVLAAADSLNLPCTVERRSIAEMAERRSVGLEEAGRQERHAFFERVCLNTGARAVALAHHADDNAETVLQRVLRGTGLRGLAGIPRARSLDPFSGIRLVRPLLRFTKKQLGDYLLDRGIASREDRSNLAAEPSRNRIRNVLIPRIEAEFNPQVREALMRLAEQAQWLEEYLSETVQRTFDTLVITHNDQMIVLNAEVMARKSRIVQTELIRLAYRSFGLGEQNLSFNHLVAAMELVTESASGKQVQLPGGMLVEKRYGQLIFAVPSAEPREAIAPEIAVHVPGSTVLPMRRMELECTIRDVAAEEIPVLRRAAKRTEEYVDFDALHLPLVVRTRRPGDRFIPLGAPGSKTVSDFLADAKVDPSARKRVAVLCDRLGPVWLVGHRIDDRVKMTALTKRVAQLRCRSLDD